MVVQRIAKKLLTTTFLLFSFFLPSLLQADDVTGFIGIYKDLKSPADIRAFFQLLGEYARGSPLTLEQSRALITAVNNNPLTISGQPGQNGVVGGGRALPL